MTKNNYKENYFLLTKNSPYQILIACFFIFLLKIEQNNIEKIMMITISSNVKNVELNK